MMRLSLVMIFLLPFIKGFTQYSSPTLIYRLSNEAYEAKIRSKKFKLEPSDCQQYIGTKDSLLKLEPGYYIFAKAQEESLNLSLHDYTNLSTILLNNERDFAVQILDTAGQLVAAAVWLNHKKVRYDIATKSYRLSKHKKGGLLKVAALGQVVFYEVEAEEIYNNRRKFQHTRVGYYVMTPVRWGKNIYRFFKNGFEWGEWRVNWRGLNPIKTKPKSLKGYIALNKPIYRHGDTLQLKAYVTNKNGKPWKKELRFNIQQRNSYNEYSIDTLVLTDKNGTFLYHQVISDSLQLDQYYSITLKAANDKYNSGLYHTFKLEDYQLDEVDYTFSSTKETYQKGENIILSAEGKDKNGFTIPDGEVTIVALRGNLKSTDLRELRIPDTLWTHTQSLDTRGTTQIIFPDSLLPKAELNIKFQATFTNSNGEMQEKSAEVSYVSLNRTIDIKIENGYIIANYKEGEKSLPAEAELVVEGDENINFTKKIQLPLKEKLHPFGDDYLVRVDKDVVNDISLYDESANIIASGIYKKDSIFINIINPHQIPVNYWIIQGNHIIEKGQINENQWQWWRKDDNRQTYYFQYQYYWGSKTKSDIITIQSLKRLLNVEVNQPQKVLPGAPVQMQVKVHDQRNNKIQGVNLTAGAINAQFNSAGSFSEIKITDKNIKPIKKYANFHIEYQDDFTSRYPLTKDWYSKFNLQEQPFYRLRATEQPVCLHYDSIKWDTSYKNIAQFAPYVVNNGLMQPVIMAYCNRQLVYYYETGNNTPYSFIGKAGYNLITIRTPKYEYWIDSVLLKQGQKLELIIDEALFRENKIWKRKIMPDSLLTSERKLLKDKMFVLKGPLRNKNYCYIWQDSNSVHRFYNEGPQRFPVLIGPFQPYYDIHYVEQNGFATRFNFEPGFSYMVAPLQQQLYEFSYFDHKMPLPKKIPYKYFGQTIYKLSDIKYYKKESLTNISFESYYYNPYPKDGGDYQFTYQNKTSEAIRGFALLKDTSFTIGYFTLSANSFKRLTPGNYTMIFVNYKDEIARHSFTIQRDTLLYERLDTLIWQKDTSDIILKLFYVIETETTYNKTRLKESFDISPYFGAGSYVHGYVKDKSGEPLIGVNILIKGTTIGAATDTEGYYSLIIPKEITKPVIEVSYVGFITKEVKFNINNKNYDVIMREDATALEEVVVVGYSVQSKRNLTSSFSSFNINNLQGRVAGVSITPEGIPFQQERTLPLFEDPRDFGDTPLSIESSGIRSNFRDYAYWQPNLITDQNGEAYFTVTYPDNITSWNTFVLGMDRKLRAGVAYGNTKSYKPLLAQLAMPRFLVEGDEVDIIGKSVNYTNDTLLIKTSFKIDGQLLQENNKDVIDGITEKAKVVAPAQQDSFQSTYALAMGEYVDGEQRSIPIFRRGMEDTKGYFYVLNKDTTIQITPQLPEGQMEVHIEGNMLNDIIREILKLKNYQYGCNEQTASRLLAALMDKKLRSNWVKNM